MRAHFNDHGVELVQVGGNDVPQLVLRQSIVGCSGLLNVASKRGEVHGLSASLYRYLGEDIQRITQCQRCEGFAPDGR